MAETKKETSRQARQPADDTAETLSEAASRSGEEAARAAQEVVEEGGHKIERLSERQSEAMKRTTRAAEETMSAGATVMTRSGNAMARGWQDVGQTMMDYLQDTTRHNMEATESMLRCRTFGELMQAQSQYMRQSLDTMMQKSARISDISARMLSETAQPMAQLAGREREEREPRNARR
ncbi:MAG: phasin family protein [Alphaproteobacteria bacterium]|nr:phasin family protein [Alphaproteobacteria bacterium]